MVEKQFIHTKTVDIIVYTVAKKLSPTVRRNKMVIKVKTVDYTLSNKEEYDVIDLQVSLGVYISECGKTISGKDLAILLEDAKINDGW